MTQKLNQKFVDVEDELNGLLEERMETIHGIILASLSGTNILLLGPKGIAKSLLVSLWNQRIVGSKYFSWLLTKFTTPDELYGPASIVGLKEGKFYRETRGKLPEANTAFLDETFKANSSILNTLLTIMNERIFYNGDRAIPINLITLAGASNEKPDEDDGLDAFYDRFVLKFHVKPIQEEGNFRRMLLNDSIEEPPKHTVSLDDIHQAQREIVKITIPETVLDNLTKIRADLETEGIHVSDRTFKVALKVLRAETWMKGRIEMTTDDLEVLSHICWNEPEHEKKVRGVILERIAPEKNKIRTMYEECLQMVKEALEQKEVRKRNDKYIEVSQKIKITTNDIAKYKRDMINRKQDTKEIDQIETQLVRLLSDFTERIIGQSPFNTLSSSK